MQLFLLQITNNLWAARSIPLYLNNNKITTSYYKVLYAFPMRFHTHFLFGPEGETGVAIFIPVHKCLNQIPEKSNNFPEVTWLIKCRNGSPCKQLALSIDHSIREEGDSAPLCSQIQPTVFQSIGSTTCQEQRGTRVDIIYQPHRNLLWTHLWSSRVTEKDGIQPK